LIFDACNSGQAINDFRANAMATQVFLGSGNSNKSQQVKSVDKLNEKSGFFILSASAPDQSAFEVTQLSQGLLTYALLSAVKNNSEILDDKNVLSIGKWFDVAGETVTKLIKENGAIQDPQIVRNNNFSVGIVDKEIIAGINLPAEIPLFAPTNFQNKNDSVGYDDKELSKLVNSQLSKLSSRGTNNKIMYVNSTNSPDAYTLAGRYSITDNDIKVSFNVVLKGKSRKQLEVTGSLDKLEKLAEDIASAATEWVMNNK